MIYNVLNCELSIIYYILYIEYHKLYRAISLHSRVISIYLTNIWDSRWVPILAQVHIHARCRDGNSPILLRPTEFLRVDFNKKCFSVAIFGSYVLASSSPTKPKALGLWEGQLDVGPEATPIFLFGERFWIGLGWFGLVIFCWESSSIWPSHIRQMLQRSFRMEFAWKNDVYGVFSMLAVVP